MKVKLKKFKVRHIIGQAKPDNSGAVQIGDVMYNFDKVYTVGADIDQDVYEQNKHLFTLLKEK